MWTSVSKPIDANWTKLNPGGLEMYDDPNVMFDDPSVFYDGIDYGVWTDVPKPTGGAIIFAGFATGLITPPTYSRSWGADPWTKVVKPI